MSLKIDVSTSFTALLQVVKKLKIINMADRFPDVQLDLEFHYLVQGAGKVICELFQYRQVMGIKKTINRITSIGCKVRR